MNRRTLVNVDVSMQDTKGHWMVWWVMKWNDSYIMPFTALLFKDVYGFQTSMLHSATKVLYVGFSSNMSPICSCVANYSSIIYSGGIVALAAGKVLKAESSQRRGALPPICPSNGKKGRQKTTVLTLSNATPTQSLPFPDSHTLPWHIICYCRKCDH